MYTRSVKQSKKLGEDLDNLVDKGNDLSWVSQVRLSFCIISTAVNKVLYALYRCVYRKGEFV